MSLSVRYLVIQGLVLVFMFLAMLTPGSSFNGYMSLSRCAHSLASVLFPMRASARPPARAGTRAHVSLTC